MTKHQKTPLLAKLKANWKSGLTVSLVSIPMSVSLAVASNSSPVIGIITAVWAGLFASLFGGSNYNIVGPTGALSGLLATYAILHGSQSLAMLAIVTGFFVLLAWYFKFERYLVYVPASTIQGFTLGVAFIIGLNQLNYALGITGLKSHERFVENVIESLSHINQTSFADLSVFVIFFAGLMIIPKLSKKIPGAIALSPIGILLGYLSIAQVIPVQILTLGQKFANLTPTLFIMPEFKFETSLLIAGMTVALVAILETMISAKVADGMTKTKHHKRKEMLGLGLANLASGVMGGIPATAALARTSLNIKTGATDKISATISSVMIVVISFIFLTYFKYIPMAVIAAILVNVAIKMVEREHLIRMYKTDKKSFYIAIIVAIVTIYEDPIIGILFGTAISLILFMEKLSKGQFELIVNKPHHGITQHLTDEHMQQIDTKNHDTLVYSIKGQLAYINCQSHIIRFEEKINKYKNVIFRLRELYFIDLDGVDAIEEIIVMLESQGKKVYITGVNPLIEKMLHESKAFLKLKEQNRVLEKSTDALRVLGFEV